MQKLIFEKNYTRDTTILIQQIWAQELSKGIAEKKGWENPHLPMIIHYMRNGTVEIWDNELAREWLMDRLLEENLKDETQILGTIEHYKKQLQKIKPYWKKGHAETLEEFREYLNLLPDLMFDFNQWYYTVTNEKTPKHLIEIILAVRKDDVFFATNDMYISATLKKLFPEISGFESAVLFEEITSIPPKEVHKKRLEGAALIDGVTLFVGDPVDFSKKYPSYVLKGLNADKNISSVKGQPAFKGNVHGVVRLLYRRDQIEKVRTGDIIVSPMTTPDFLSAMNNAAAFVTDEGGITCHAAIVAREMKKPCVIGTKIATQVFKDGDLVEVDADRGIVTLIS